MLTLFKFLNKYDNEYIIYYDFSNRPYGDKTFEDNLLSIKKWIDFLKSKWIEKIILPPIYELSLHAESLKLNAKKSKKNEKNKKEHYSDLILPLFKNYVLDYCMKYSLVWKIWLIWDFADIQTAQKLMKDLEKDYKLNDHQRNIKKFNNPFVYRAKEVNMRKYFLTTFSYSDFMVNKVIKFDLRYFKDAMVDTMIPMNYWYFNFQKTISKYFNFKKIKFHKFERLEEIFQTATSCKLQAKWKYDVKIFYTWHCELLKREKRLMWLLEKGKTIELWIMNVELWIKIRNDKHW